MIELLRITLSIIVLIVIAYIDFRKTIIPNKIVYPAIIVIGVLNVFSPEMGFVNALVGGGCLAVFFIIAALILKNIGMGDIKLGFLMGLMTGFPEGMLALIGGVLFGGLVAVTLVLLRIRDKKSTIPYGPFLAAGTIFTLIGMQLSLFGFLYTI